MHDPARPLRLGDRGGGHADGRRAVRLRRRGRDRCGCGTWRRATAVHALPGHDGWVYAVAVTGDGRRAVSGAWDRTVRVWDLEAGAAVHALPGHDGGVTAVAVTADGRRAVSGGRDGTVRVWDLEAGTAVHALPATTAGCTRWRSAATAAAPSPAAAMGRCGCGTWTRAPRCTPCTGHDRWVDRGGGQRRRPPRRLRRLGRRDGAGVGPGDGRGGARPARPRPRRGVRGGGQRDGRRAVSGGGDGTVRVWDLETGRRCTPCPATTAGATAVAVSADGRRAVSGGADGTVRVWDLATGKQIASASQRTAALLTRSGKTHPSVSQRHPFLSISADGRRAVSGGDDGTVRVWDLETGAAVHALPGHDGRVSGGGQRGRPPRGLRRRGRDGAGVGPGGGRGGARPARPRRRGARGGGQRGRAPRGLRRRRRDSADVGPGARRGIRLLRVRQQNHCPRRHTARHARDSGHLTGPVHLLELCAYEQPPGA